MRSIRIIHRDQSVIENPTDDQAVLYGSVVIPPSAPPWYDSFDTSASTQIISDTVNSSADCMDNRRNGILPAFFCNICRKKKRLLTPGTGGYQQFALRQSAVSAENKKTPD